MDLHTNDLYFEETVKSISEIVRFDSSQTAPTHNAPFGKGAADCLSFFLDLAQSFGFETKNYDNYVGEVVFGDGTEEFAVLCHLDVVPAGDGWTKPAFGGIVEDGKIWGRGTTDDKGPAICCLYALKSLKEAGFVPSKRIKLIVGCNEESGWGCIEHYNAVAQMPETGFSPDADFPVIYAEKGILHLRLHFDLSDSPIIALSGGKQANMVCDRCDAVPRSREGLAELFRKGVPGLVFDGRKIIARGKSAHASTPDQGVNAIERILRFFAKKDPRIQHMVACLFDDKYGLKKLKDETGSLTMSPDVVRMRRDDVSLLVDIRYPASMQEKDILQKVGQFGTKFEILHSQAPLYHDKNSPLVTELLSVYEECTGQKAEPVAIGGGTYARALKNCVGFGPEMPGEISPIHQADEYISLDRVRLLLDVYGKAIERLTK